MIHMRPSPKPSALSQFFSRLASPIVSGTIAQIIPFKDKEGSLVCVRQSDLSERFLSCSTMFGRLAIGQNGYRNHVIALAMPYRSEGQSQKMIFGIVRPF
jgi:hypothetical protein